MDPLDAGRQLIGHSLAFHIIIVALSIGLPFLISIFEWLAWRSNSERLRGFVRLLAKWAAVFVIGGVMSGTIIALQFSTLWAPFLDASRPQVGKFFQLEGYMFLIEAAFLSWYFATMKQVGTRKHFLISLPINIGTIGSAFFITAVNAWMNNPSAQFTTTTANEISHSVVSYLFSTTLLVLAFVAWRSLRKQSKPAMTFINKLMGQLSIIALVLMGALGVLGHQSAVDIGNTQPHKLAAIELLDKTGPNAPMRIGGEMTDAGKAEGGIVIPSLLSILAGYSPGAVVKGLDQIPRDKWPPLVVHALFDIKMALVGLSTALIVLAMFFYWRYKSFPRLFRTLLVPFGFIGLVMVELGWYITELGRQSWTIVGKQLTADAFTVGANIHNSIIVFVLLFGVLGLSTLFALSYTTKHWRNTEKQSW